MCSMRACVCVCVYTHTWAIMPSWQQASRCCIKLTALPCPLAPNPAQSASVRIRLWLRADGAPSAHSHSAHPVQAAVAAAMTIPHRLPEPRASCRRCAGPASSSCSQCIAVVRDQKPSEPIKCQNNKYFFLLAQEEEQRVSPIEYGKHPVIG